MLEEARTAPYPSSKNKKKINVNPPLSFDIDLRERSPTAEEFTDLIYLAEAPSYTFFLKQGVSTSFTWHPTNAESLCKMVEKDPTVIRWPIVVNYKARQVAFTQAGVKSVLKALVAERDNKLAKLETPQPPIQPSISRISPRNKRVD